MLINRGELKSVFRSLSRDKLFFCGAVLSLAIGIGINLALVAVANVSLLQRLPFNHPDELVSFETVTTQHGGEAVSQRVNLDGLEALTDLTTLLSDVGSYSGGKIVVSTNNHLSFAPVLFVDQGYLNILGQSPYAGRPLAKGDISVAVAVSNSFAVKSFGSPQQALGMTMHVEGGIYKIVSIFPDRHSYPSKADVWVPVPKPVGPTDRTARGLLLIGRLAPKVSLKELNTALATTSPRLKLALGQSDNAAKLVAVSFRNATTEHARPLLQLLLSLSIILFVLCCLNIFTLQLSRAATSLKDMNTRYSLGAPEYRVFIPLCLEGLVITVSGVLMATIVYNVAARIFASEIASLMPLVDGVHLGSVGILMFVLTILAALFSAAIMPSMVSLSTSDIAQGANSKSRLSSRTMKITRRVLVAFEICLAFVLTFQATVVSRQLVSQMRIDLGFNPAHLIAVNADAPANSDPKSAQAALSTITGTIDEIRLLPGVVSAAGAMGMPGSNYRLVAHAGTLGEASARWPEVDVVYASPGYLRTMQIPLAEGRDLLGTDNLQSPYRALVSRSFAREEFGGEKPLDRTLICEGCDTGTAPISVVGVVGDVRRNQVDKRVSTIYMPLAQHPYMANQLDFVVRPAVSDVEAVKEIQDYMQSRSGQLASEISKEDDLLLGAIQDIRLQTALISCFAAIALLLTILGVSNVVSYNIIRERRDNAIRLCLGATAHGLIRDITLSYAKTAACGIAVGIAISITFMRVAQHSIVLRPPVSATELFAAALIVEAIASLSAYAASLSIDESTLIQYLRE